MIVVADAGPLRFVAIGAADVLKTLYDRVLVPEAVAAELQDAKTPATVRAWIAQPPVWFEIRPNPPFDPALRFLDAGERAAIAFAISIAADGLLMDEWDGRAEAKRRRLLVAEPSAFWPMRTSLVCLISRPPLRSFAPLTFTSPMTLSLVSGNGCPERRRNDGG